MAKKFVSDNDLGKGLVVVDNKVDVAVDDTTIVVKDGKLSAVIPEPAKDIYINGANLEGKKLILTDTNSGTVVVDLADLVSETSKVERAEEIQDLAGNALGWTVTKE